MNRTAACGHLAHGGQGRKDCQDRGQADHAGNADDLRAPYQLTEAEKSDDRNLNGADSEHHFGAEALVRIATAKAQQQFADPALY